MRCVRWMLCGALCITLCLSVSGCFYRRLLALKNQFKKFEKYFVLEEGDTVAMIFKKPVMLTEDTERFLGLKPTTIRGEAPNAIYEYRVVKQYAPHQKEEGNFNYTYQVVMKDNKIERFVFEKRFFATTPKPMFVLACKMIGHANVNLVKRSLTMKKINPEPYLDKSVFLNADEVRQLSGIPYKVIQNNYVYRYRIQQEGDESSWPEIFSTVSFTDQGEFLRGESSIMGGMVVERPLNVPTYPVPGDATAVNPETLTTLGWTGGYKAKTHRIYGGEDKRNLMLLGKVSKQNEISLPARDQSAPYYWRVDALHPDGTCHPGPLWRFVPGKLVGHWTFDQNSGGMAHDVSGAQNHGTLRGDAAFKPGAGMLGAAVYLDGDGDGIDVNDVSLQAHAITMATWIKGHHVERVAGLVHFEDSLWGAGLYWVRGDHLYYNWYCDSLNSGYFQGPSLPKEEWAFVACVVDYDRATLYVYTRSRGLKTRANKVPHRAQRISKLRIGCIKAKDNRRFKGLMDDVRIYNYALTPEQIEDIIDEL